MPWLLDPRERNPKHLLFRRLGGPQNRLGVLRQERYLLYLPARIRTLGCLTHSIVSIPTAL